MEESGIRTRVVDYLKANDDIDLIHLLSSCLEPFIEGVSDCEVYRYQNGIENQESKMILDGS